MQVLFALHDAGGTVPPVLAVAQALRAAGHGVSVLSQPSVRARAEASGCRFVPFSALGDYDRRTPLEEQLERTLPALAGVEVGADLVAVVERERPDVVVVDPNLSGCLAAAASAPPPSAVLLHSMYRTFVDVWFGEIWPLLASGINRTRDRFGRPPAESWAAMLDEHDLLLPVVPAAFDAPVDRPVPATVRHCGFLVPTVDAAAHGGAAFPGGGEPAVLVGLSTTAHRQGALLAEIVAALGDLPVRALVTTAGQVDAGALSRPANVAVVDRAPHGALLPQTDVVVTHAGLGTVAAALAAGVPLVCAPGGRDQPLNAQRVAAVGAGVVVDEPSGATVAAGVERVLADRAFRRAAEAMRAVGEVEGGPTRAAAELEAILVPP